ncbi:hypothetical protein CK203_031448 [Vitis vinifera]|uniref:Peroxisomal membrane protein 2 n=1 Tax=Vitis vinifera TaxID=29760 RepID=A0A438I8X0_VITVI|nr:hypothetical protein CK203_031448 [Vitis vinifera]
MVISGVVYSLGDWIAQCYEGKPLFEFDRARMLRSGLVGFTLHGSLSHYYYQFCEALFPFQDWWVVPAKVAFDQTLWAAVWNSIYYTVVGFLRFDSPANVFGELRATFWPMLTGVGRLITDCQNSAFCSGCRMETLAICSPYYIWCDPSRTKAPVGGLCRAHLGDNPFNIYEKEDGHVSKIASFLFASYSNEKSEARVSEASAEPASSSPPTGSPELLLLTSTIFSLRWLLDTLLSLDYILHFGNVNLRLVITYYFSALRFAFIVSAMRPTQYLFIRTRPSQRLNRDCRLVAATPERPRMVRRRTWADSLSLGLVRRGDAMDGGDDEIRNLTISLPQYQSEFEGELPFCPSWFMDCGCSTSQTKATSGT